MNDRVSQPPPRSFVSKDYQQAKCCLEENGADIELFIGGFSWLVINGGCGIKYQNHPCPLCILQYPIGRETEYLICVA